MAQYFYIQVGEDDDAENAIYDRKFTTSAEAIDFMIDILGFDDDHRASVMDNNGNQCGSSKREKTEAKFIFNRFPSEHDFSRKAHFVTGKEGQKYFLLKVDSQGGGAAAAAAASDDEFDYRVPMIKHGSAL